MNGGQPIDSSSIDHSSKFRSSRRSLTTRLPEGLTLQRDASTLRSMSNKEPEASEQYHDGNERDVEAKQRESVAESAAVRHGEIDPSKVQVLPGTGGPDDVGDTRATPSDYNRSGH